MRKLYDLNRRWDSLMTEEELDTTEFEKESKNVRKWINLEDN